MCAALLLLWLLLFSLFVGEEEKNKNLFGFEDLAIRNYVALLPTTCTGKPHLFSFLLLSQIYLACYEVRSTYQVKITVGILLFARGPSVRDGCHPHARRRICCTNHVTKHGKK